MAKTVEKRKRDFAVIMKLSGFAPNGETLSDGRGVCSRVWDQEVTVAWKKKEESRLEIKIDEKDGIPTVRIYKNGRLERRRSYSTPNRMANALREIVTFNGFEF